MSVDLMRCRTLNKRAIILIYHVFFYAIYEYSNIFQDPNTNYNGYNNYHYGTPILNSCDASDQYSEYRLCWSFRSNFGRGGGDRCGSMKNLHNEADWERVIYQAV